MSPQELISDRNELEGRYGKTPEDTVQTAEDLSMRAEESMMSFRSNYKVGRIMSKIEDRAQASRQSLDAVQQEMTPKGQNNELYGEFVKTLSTDPTAADLYDQALSSVDNATAQWLAAGAHCRSSGSYVGSQVALNERFEAAQHNLSEVASGMPTPPGTHSIDRRLGSAHNVLQAAMRRGPAVVPAPQVAPTAAPTAQPTAQPRATQTMGMTQSLGPGGPKG